MNKRIEAAYAQRPRRWVFELAVALVIMALLVWSGSAVETAGTTQSGATIAWNILAGIFHPDTDLLFNFTTQGVPYLLLETICIAFLGTVVGAIISIPLAFLSASNLTPRPVAFAGRLDRNDYWNRGREAFADLDRTVGLWSDYAAGYLAVQGAVEAARGKKPQAAGVIPAEPSFSGG